MNRLCKREAIRTESIFKDKTDVISFYGFKLINFKEKSIRAKHKAKIVTENYSEKYVNTNFSKI
jgi:hypothetical protein